MAGLSLVAGGVSNRSPGRSLGTSEPRHGAVMWFGLAIVSVVLMLMAFGVIDGERIW
jgi:hypothetical protein